MGMKILSVVGARPNFMKIAPIIEAVRIRSEHGLSHGGQGIGHFLVHTGQHYDREMSALFFEQLGIPSPDVNLEVGSASQAVQTAEIMKKFEPICLEQRPSHVLVVGDVNSTIACALVAAKLGIRVVHVEAGLRSFDRGMPEEINRILTDAISDILFTTEESANVNLRREGVSKEKVHFVGNVMIDTLLKHKSSADNSAVLKTLGVQNVGSKPCVYGVLTLHRPATVENLEVLRGVLDGVSEIAKEMPVFFPVHPRTKIRMQASGLRSFLQQGAYAETEGKDRRGGIFGIDPLGYLDFLKLMSCASVVLTDSGGIQEETTILRVPCVTIRDSTERPITVLSGTNVIAGTSTQSIVSKTRQQLNSAHLFGREGKGLPGAGRPPLWDGRAAERIVDILVADSGKMG
jgi:UDP-N-acetylglucosamine 2-epimerase (non-hydrolysing)